MAPINNAQRTMRLLSIWSCLFMSIVWVIILRVGDFSSRKAAGIAALWILLIFAQTMLAFFLGKRVDKQLLLESRLAQKLRELEISVAIRERERKLMQDHLLEAIIIVNNSNKIIFLNRAAKKLLNVPVSLEEQTLAELIREPEIHELIAQAKDQHTDLEACIKLNWQQPTAVYAKIALMDDANVMVSLLDARQFNAFDERHDDFIAHASHELKTPVAIILANAELLLDEPPQTKSSRLLLNAIHRQALRAKNLLESLLDLLRLNAGHYDVKLEAIDLRRVVDDLKESLGHTGSIITNEIAPGTTICTDRELFDRLAHILIENAQKYAGIDPRLTISALHHGDCLKIQFIDNGPGIKNHLRERVFEQFFRSPEHESAEKEGFGLGLSHARAIARHLRGHIFVDESTGRGCTITLMLDAAEKEVKVQQRSCAAIN